MGMIRLMLFVFGELFFVLSSSVINAVIQGVYKGGIFTFTIAVSHSPAPYTAGYLLPSPPPLSTTQQYIDYL